MIFRVSHAVSIAALGLALPLAAGAQTALTTQSANDGTYAANLHWINFAGLTGGGGPTHFW
jgi:hypothetical protein